MSTPTPTELRVFLRRQILRTKSAITAREQGEQAWRTGTDADFRLSRKLHPSLQGTTTPPKKQRIALADRERAIANLLRVELDHYAELLRRLGDT